MENNDKDPKFEVVDHVKILKYKRIFAKGYAPNWSEEVYVINKAENAVLWTYIKEDLMVEKMLESFVKKNCARQIKESLDLNK